jgi:hypothetical protein
MKTLPVCEYSSEEGDILVLLLLVRLVFELVKNQSLHEERVVVLSI